MSRTKLALIAALTSVLTLFTMSTAPAGATDVTVAKVGPFGCC